MQQNGFNNHPLYRFNASLAAGTLAKEATISQTK